MTEDRTAADSAAPHDSEAPQTTLRAMLAVIVSTGIIGLTFGYSLPLLAIIMENANISSTMIGLSAASESAAILIFGRFAPRLISALGLRKTMFVAISIGVISLGAVAFTDPYTVWFPLRFILGGTIFLSLIASDIWVAQGSSTPRRGLMIAIYGTSITGGMAAGTLLVPLVGSDGTFPILIGAAILAGAALPLLITYGPAPAMAQAVKLNARALLLVAPLLVAGVFAFGVVDSSALSLLPVFGLHLDMSELESTRLLTFLVAGSILLQLPIGWLSDHMDRHSVLKICAVTGTAAAIVFPFTIGADWAMWISLFVLGGAISGLYIVSLAIVGDRYHGGELAVAVVLIAMIFAVGSTLGPLVSGAAIDLWDPYGLNVIIVAALIPVLALAIMWSGRRRST
ncbi:MAG: putative MFS-type transporter YcaD [Alphaproteobacteria bacterium MarineAlpha10_Bin1]|nr:MAG: putative MFS-type transporter YcaD [Alphaproteobacteria bacterium MarineAlpha10_Bin1]